MAVCNRNDVVVSEPKMHKVEKENNNALVNVWLKSKTICKPQTTMHSSHY